MGVTPIVLVADDGLQCLLCGRDLIIAGTHFARKHGIRTEGMTVSERQKLFGLTQGQRLASRETLEKHRLVQREIYERKGPAVGFKPFGGEKKPPIGRVLAPQSEIQKRSRKRNLSRLHAFLNARVVVSCGCGAPVEINVRRYCRSYLRGVHDLCVKCCGGRRLALTRKRTGASPRKPTSHGTLWMYEALNCRCVVCISARR